MLASATMPTREEILAAEEKVLQAMCSGTPEGTVWDKGMLLLDSYSFQDLVHQLIFETLQEINTDLPHIIRQQLPSRLTRKGFPAAATEKFLLPHSLDAGQAIDLMKKLQQWSKSQGSGSARG